MKQNAKQQALLHLLELTEKSEHIWETYSSVIKHCRQLTLDFVFFYVSKEKDDEDELRDR